VIEVPSSADADSLLEAFMEWTDSLGVELYDAQEEGILELFDGSNVVLNTPTGSGKSLVAVALHFRSLARGERSVYTSPIKALVSEKFFSLCTTFGAENVGMMTGDGAINPDAPIICCTAEILSNQALRHGSATPVDSVVMDEFHYYSDRDRGTAWQIPLLILKKAQFLLMSATLGETQKVVDALEELTGQTSVVVSSDERPVPLEFTYSEHPLLSSIEKLIATDKAPIYLVNFSQREASEQAQRLVSGELLDKARRKALRDELKGFRFDSPYGKKLRRYLEHGVGVHHAGLLPKYRLLVERLAQRGVLAVISGTDTLGVGVNVPIRSVLFTRLYKYDGVKSATLTVRDFKQIAGRAGRRGFDTIGHVVCQAPEHVIENKKREAKVASGQMAKKKFRREQPPRGYVQYDRTTFERLQEGTPEALTSVFTVDHGMLLNLMQRDPDDANAGWDAMLELVDRSHGGPTDKVRAKQQTLDMLRSLVDAGVVRAQDAEDLPDTPLWVDPELQAEFSVFHSLALFVLDALTYLEPESEDYAFKILTLVESIQENPRQILGAQRHRARGEAVAEMKAEGMDYNERMEALEDVDYPKPEADWLYDRINSYLDERPWLEAEHVRPKSIAREMVESWSTFHEFVRELKLEAVEGVLLRYLNQVYKVLARTIPEFAQTDELLDVIAFLRTAIANADSSLLTEWEKLLEEPDLTAEDAPPPPPPDISRNKRTFVARIRAELHHLLRALHLGELEDAIGCVLPDEDWDTDSLDAALAPLLAEVGRIRFDQQARFADKTTVKPVEDHVWEVSQALIDFEGEIVGSIDGIVDLRDDASPAGPMIRLLAIG
jgi:superfamily II DNA helicase RecQ